MRSDCLEGSLPHWCVFTASDVVCRALDAVDWRPEVDLSRARLLEPAAGDGAFVVEAVRRLLASRSARRDATPWTHLRNAITAFEIEPSLAVRLRERVSGELERKGLGRCLAQELALAWCREGDFLVANLKPHFSHVVGNPPFGRGGGTAPDHCVAFLQKSFSALLAGGRMAMLAPASIGSALGARSMRACVNAQGSLTAIETFNPRQAFVRRVQVVGALYVFVRERCDAEVLQRDETWLAGSPEAKAAFEDAVSRYPTLEDAGCRIRVGMATGKNGVFVRSLEDADVEEDLLAPAVAIRDLSGGAVRWRGLYVIRTARSNGRPWTTREKPRLYRYLSAHKRELEARHHVQNRGASWRLTLMPFDQQLAEAPKVLVAETAKPCRVALDQGGYMPLNSLHAVTSTEWPLDALAAILSAGAVGLVAHAFKLARNGGHLRVNATALRRVRIPRWHALSGADRIALISGRADFAMEAIARIYRLDDDLLRMCAAKGEV